MPNPALGPEQEQRFSLAVNRLRNGDLAGAERLLRELAAALPEQATIQLHLAMACHLQQRWDAAVLAYQRAIAAAPEDPSTHYGLGLALFEQGQIDSAIDSYQRALALRPDFGEACNNLGVALLAAHRVDEAIAAARRAVELNPSIAVVHCNLGNALSKGEQFDRAIDCYRRAIALGPGLADAHNGLGVALQRQGELSRAFESYERALAIRPSFVEAATNLTHLGSSFREQGRIDEAIATLQRALQIDPACTDAWDILGNIFNEAHRPEESLAAFERAIEHAPQLARVHQNHALALLMQGRLEQGFAEYEWRLKVEHLAEKWKPGGFSQPRCQLDNCRGQRVFVHAEQGLGDTIQFVRYVPELAARGAQVILSCQPSLERLLSRLDGHTSLQTWSDPVPGFDSYVPMMSLPHLFGTTLESIPGRVPYLRPDPAGERAWRRRLGANSLNVGVVWAGRPEHAQDRKRSLPLATLGPLAGVPGVRLHSLQKGAAARQLDALRPDFDLVDLAPELNDFADTADLVAALDLVISVDTAVAHLAGALGRPVWLLCKYESEWRWMRDRDNSPWYPTMRLFRQPRPGEWVEVIERVRAALAEVPLGAAQIDR